MSETLRIGSRGSDLALWQARWVQSQLSVPTEIVIIKTAGDRIQHLTLDKVEGKGFFTKELEQALHDQSIDLAVHSLKDLPTEDPPGLTLAAVSARASVHDVLILKREQLETWTHEPLRIGTSSLRRQAQLRRLNPSLELVPIRGNVPTRIEKIASEGLDGVALAEAGVTRLGKVPDQHDALSMVRLSLEQCCPAPAQGALGIQCRAHDDTTKKTLRALHHEETARAVAAEREVLRRFGGGCQLPLGVCVGKESEAWIARATVTSPDGREHADAVLRDAPSDALADHLHAQLCAQGASHILNALTNTKVITP